MMMLLAQHGGALPHAALAELVEIAVLLRVQQGREDFMNQRIDGATR
jgi:hypothetical protein